MLFILPPTPHLLLHYKEVVWPETKQIGLIDSIFRNFYVPPVVFAVQKDEDDEDVRICVDGKQVRTAARIAYAFPGHSSNTHFSV
jgi:hypothetical protein